MPYEELSLECFIILVTYLQTPTAIADKISRVRLAITKARLETK